MTDHALDPSLVAGARPPAAADTDRTIGIAPVPTALRQLRSIDVAVLWGNLSIGILVLAAGALLVIPPDSGGLGLSLPAAALAVLVGSLAGAYLLAAVAWVGHDPGQPSMALLRGVLGRHGSYAASVLNIVQLVGWTAFELWAMSQFAGRICIVVFGGTSQVAWIVAVAVACAVLALAGPLAVVRLALERVGTWVLLAACAALTLTVLVHGLHGTRGSAHAAPFAVAVDLVVAMPVSWLSVVADYNRFATDRRSNFRGTFAGSFVGNSWLYLLGVLLVLTGRLSDASPAGVAVSVVGAGAGTAVGLLVLAGLLAGEVPNAFADIYSTVVSTQNVARRVPYRLAVVVTVALAALIAALATVSDFEKFLYLLGSVFVPLFAVVLAHGLVSRARRPIHGRAGARVSMLAAWAAGFVTYQWIVPTGPDSWVRWLTDHVPGAGDHATLGASLPSFGVAFAFAAAAAATRRRLHAQK